MKPKLGDVIIYTDSHHHERAALVTHIHHDETIIDLAVFYPNRLDFKQGVKYDIDHDSETWHFKK